MQTHVSEAAAPEDNMPGRFAWGHRVHRMLFKANSAFNYRERGSVSGYIVGGTSSGRMLCQRDRLRIYINWR
jgi:hypothetical protein